MSALAPTTSNALPLPQELTHLTLAFLGPASQDSFRRVNKRAREETDEYYIEQIVQNGALVRAYTASQELEEPLKEGVKKRMKTFTQEMRSLLGGSAYIEKIQARIGPLINPASQIKLIKARWNCKVVGLLPLLKQIPEAQGCLSEVALLQSDEEKFSKMVDWIRQNPEPVSRLTQVSIISCRKEDVKNQVNPRFFSIPGKVYNYVPKEISLFTHLKSLSLYNNLLNKLPNSMKTMLLEELNIGRNHFTEMPPVIPSLRRLILTENQIPFQKMARYVLNYIQEGGGDLEIHFDSAFSPDLEFQKEFRKTFPSTHTLEIGVGGVLLRKHPSRKGIPLYPVE